MHWAAWWVRKGGGFTGGVCEEQSCSRPPPRAARCVVRMDTGNRLTIAFAASAAADHPPPGRAGMNHEAQTAVLLRHGVVIGPDGQQIGEVGQVYISNDTGQPLWVTVKTGSFGSESFVPLHDAEVIADQVTVPYDQAIIEGGPHRRSGWDLTAADEDDLYQYYGIEPGSDRATTRPADPPKRR